MSNICKNKKTIKEEYSIPNTMGIVGVEGSGKTTILTKCISKIRAEKEVRVISIQVGSDLVWKNKGANDLKIYEKFGGNKSWLDLVCKNKDAKEINIHKHFGYSKDDKTSDAVELKNVSWQNIVFEHAPAQYHPKAIEILSQKIIEFAEKSNIPCLVIVEEIWAYRHEQAQHLMQVFDALSKMDGYFLFTMNARNLPSDTVEPFLDKVDTIVDLGMHQAPHKGEISFKKSVKMEVFRTSKGTIEYGYKINPNPGFANFIDGKDLYDRTKANYFYI